jgi:hypothetical protein
MCQRRQTLKHPFGQALGWALINSCLVESTLHRLENVLMLAAGNPSLFGAGATVPDRATLAGQP